MGKETKKENTKNLRMLEKEQSSKSMSQTGGREGEVEGKSLLEPG